MIFEELGRSGDGRRGRLITNRGAIDTPAFMPVGTRGSVRTLDSGDLGEAGVGMVLANT